MADIQCIQLYKKNKKHTYHNKINKIFFFFLFLLFSIFLISCQSTPSLFRLPGLGNGNDDNDAEAVRDIGGSPSSGSRDVYASANLKALCVDDEVCGPSYAPLSGHYLYTTGQNPLDAMGCNYDYDPNLTSTFVLNRVDGSINGLQLLFSKEDLFFLA